MQGEIRIAVALIVAETLFIAAFILVGIHYLGHA